MYKGLAIIFGFLFIGEGITEVLHLPIPGNVIGMILLTFALLFKLVKIEDVEKEAELFIRNMSVMFIPPGVGIIAYWGLIKSQILPITTTLVISFLLTLILTAKLVEYLSGGER
ncbi:CidA/LrgA family protein [Thermococcus argininiproducens]|uniref:CidA/LrgA family protein n=1 Tax=Thermococcus argininiproducens TaxID=2866384 RepID=A0A9E7MBU0_9EURY|nr:MULTISPECIES: CidA/LrgA family protein [Thermococcus]KPU63787.1 effector of murein hydrolase LrgA [Thermococcus sp. EP1]USH00530.1 CidA/LrgA family protein [Thermococcus argininiproducens]